MKPRYKLYLRPPENMTKLLSRLLPREKIINHTYEFILTIKEIPVVTRYEFKDFESYQKYKKENISIYEKIESQIYNNGHISIWHGQNL